MKSFGLTSRTSALVFSPVKCLEGLQIFVKFPALSWAAFSLKQKIPGVACKWGKVVSPQVYFVVLYHWICCGHRYSSLCPWFHKQISTNSLSTTSAHVPLRGVFYVQCKIRLTAWGAAFIQLLIMSPSDMLCCHSRNKYSVLRIDLYLAKIDNRKRLFLSCGYKVTINKIADLEVDICTAVLFSSWILSRASWFEL